MDLPKFLNLLMSEKIWLTNLEVLASDDPYEGSSGDFLFPHRIWKSIEEVPDYLKYQIIDIYANRESVTHEDAFKTWFCIEEQSCMMTQFGRRQFYVSCWHAANHESVAMWRIYGSPGAGLAIITNGGRLEQALSSNKSTIYLGAVDYRDPGTVEIGMPNAFDPVVIKGAAYRYENEVRLVYWNAEDFHDALANDKWNPETMRFEDIIPEARELKKGYVLECNIATLIERVVISPFAPEWYLSTIEGLRDKMGLSFPISRSNLLRGPELIP